MRSVQHNLIKYILRKLFGISLCWDPRPEQLRTAVVQDLSSVIGKLKTARHDVEAYIFFGGNVAFVSYNNQI